MTNSKRSLSSSGPSNKKVKITDFFKAAKPVQSEKKEIEEEKENITPEKSVDAEIPNHNGPVDSSVEERSAVVSADITTDDALEQFKTKNPFDKQKWIASLTPEQKQLLQLEIDFLEHSWLTILHKELTKPYFINLKKFLRQEHINKKTVFPTANNVYSWSHLTPLYKLRVLVLGQDPYHNHNQAHGLAFSVLDPTPPPPSLKNIYKSIQSQFPAFQVPKSGNLTKWAEQGVLMLNACLTVEIHKPNSHAGKGWEQFTEFIINEAIRYNKDSGFVIMLWGSPAQKRIDKLSNTTKTYLQNFKVVRSVHPSPLSASRGWFNNKHFLECNEWLGEKTGEKIDWGLVEGNTVK